MIPQTPRNNGAQGIYKSGLTGKNAARPGATRSGGRDVALVGPDGRRRRGREAAVCRRSPASLQAQGGAPHQVGWQLAHISDPSAE